MKLGDHKFTIFIILLCLLSCGLIAAYFSVARPSGKTFDMTTIQRMLNLDIFTPDNEIEIPSAKSEKAKGSAAASFDATLGQAQTLVIGPGSKPGLAPETAKGTPEQKLKSAQFSDITTKPVEFKSEFSAGKLSFKTALTSTKLSPDMFTFESLPFDTPSAEFPLVTTDARSPEYVRATGVPLGGNGLAGAGGSVSLPPSSIYGRSPSPPTPTPPPNPPGKPEPHPPKPPEPPTEVSTSKL